MEAVCAGPFRVGSLVWQSRPGAYVFSVVCKVTFDLLPGQSRLAAAPAPVIPFDVRKGNDPSASLVAASDLVPFKVRPELLVTGHAHAPGGAPVPQMIVRVAIGGGGKALSVHGDRWLSPAGDLTESTPFVKLPLAWERAAGGPGTMNPSGIVTGDAAPVDASGRVLLPNLLALASFFPARGEVLTPVGLGPIAATWPSRRACLGSHASSWDPLRWSERPLPPEVDGAYFQAAPPDQSVAEIGPEERIFLENLHPEIPRLLTRLPRVTPRATVEMAGGSSALALRCDTLSIDADRSTATLTYRGNVPVDHPHRAGRVLVTEEADAVRVAVPARVEAPVIPPPEPAPPAEIASAAPVARTILPLGDPAARALPFEPPTSEMAAMLAALPADLRAKMSARLASLGDLSAVSVSGTTLPVPASHPVLPFAGSAGETGEAGDAGEVDDAGDTQRPPPFLIPAAWSAAGFSVSETVGFPLSPPPEVPFPDAPPPEAAAAPGDPPPAPEPQAPAPESMPSPEDYPIDRYARIEASVGLREADRAQILESHELTPAGLEHLRRHFRRLVDDEARRGKSRLMRAHDASYVATVEAERGPVTESEYVQLSIAVDAGTTEETLARLGLPAGAAMPVSRRWIARLAADPKLAARVRRAIAEEKER